MNNDPHHLLLHWVADQTPSIHSDTIFQNLGVVLGCIPCSFMSSMIPLSWAVSSGVHAPVGMWVFLLAINSHFTYLGVLCCIISDGCSIYACGCRTLHSQANVTPAQLLLNISKITCVYVKYRTNTGLTSATMSHLYHSRLHGLDEVCIVFMYVRRLSVYAYPGPRALSRR